MNKLHHVGIVVDKIEKAAHLYEKLLGCQRASKIIKDKTQKVKILFLSTGGNVALELLEPLSTHSPVTRFLKEGGKFHHLCYEVNDIEAALQKTRKQGALVIHKPVAAAAFKGRKIAWIFTPDNSLIELLESKK